MNFASIKKDMEAENRAKTTSEMEQVRELLLVIDEFEQIAKLAYKKKLIEFLQEFVKIFKEQGFHPNLAENVQSMEYGSVSVDFVAADYRNFHIIDKTKAYPTTYVFTLKTADLEIAQTHTAFRAPGGEVKFKFKNPDLGAEMKSLDNYCVALKTAIDNSEGWKFEIEPDHKTANLLNTHNEKSFSCIQEIIDAID